MSRPLSNDMLNAASIVSAQPGDAEAAGGVCRLELSSRLAGTVEVLEQQLQPWRRLAQSTVEPSVFGAPEWQIPMFRHMREVETSVDILLVGDSAEPPRLHGVVPFRLEKRRWGIPAPVITSWTNNLFFIGVPMIANADPQAILLSTLQYAADELGAKAVLLHMLPAEGAFCQALHTVADRHDLRIADIEPFERAGLICDKAFESWFNDSFSRKRRKEYRRLRSRLCESLRLRS